jgi:hypothetical protein
VARLSSDPMVNDTHLCWWWLRILQPR